MEFTALLEQFGSSMGINDLVPDSDGQCALLIDEAHEITFTPDKEDKSLILHCEIGKMDNLDKDICLELMQACLLGAETGGAALSVHKELGKVILWKRHDENFQDVTALQQALNSFLAQVINWKAHLASQPKSQSDFQTQQDIMPSFGIRI